MRAVVQRTLQSKVIAAGRETGKAGFGLTVLLGIGNDDDSGDVAYMAEKIVNLRIFEDEEGKPNLSLKDVHGEILSVIQFTFLANTKKGNRPSFVEAMRPPKSKELWEEFNKELEQDGFHVETGEFGADMQVSLENDGPFTIVLDL